MSSPRFLLVAALVLFAAGCGGGDATPPSNSGSTFAPTNTATTTLQVIDLTVGTGATVTAGNRITVGYSGFLYDPSAPDGKGRQFDSSSAFTFIVGAGTVIKGWDQGVIGMRVGGLRRLIIPPSLGYGSQQVGPIPPNSTLLFDIRLLSTG